MILLIVLYAMQGVPFGIAISTLPLILKKYLTYSEIGIISLSSLPFSTKFLFCPIVETNYFKKLGKRKSWIVPM